jgi:hypothetical protein
MGSVVGENSVYLGLSVLENTQQNRSLKVAIDHSAIELCAVDSATYGKTR